MPDRAGDQPEVVFFDAGDTLLHVYPSWTGQYLEVCRESGLAVDPAALEQAFAEALRQGFWEVDGPFEATAEASYERVKAFDVRVMRLLGFEHLPDSFYRTIGEQFARPAAWRVFPEAERTLRALARAGVRCAVISNWVWNLPELLEGLGLARHFERIVTSARVGYQKPQREIFERALASMGVAPERAMHVGDSVSADVAGAHGAGIRAVLLDRTTQATDRADMDGAGPAGPAGAPAGVPVIGDLAGLLPLVGLRQPARA